MVLKVRPLPYHQINRLIEEEEEKNRPTNRLYIYIKNRQLQPYSSFPHKTVKSVPATTLLFFFKQSRQTKQCLCFIYYCSLLHFTVFSFNVETFHFCIFECIFAVRHFFAQYRILMCVGSTSDYIIMREKEKRNYWVTDL